MYEEMISNPSWECKRLLIEIFEKGLRNLVAKGDTNWDTLSARSHVINAVIRFRDFENLIYWEENMCKDIEGNSSLVNFSDEELDLLVDGITSAVFAYYQLIKQKGKIDEQC